MLSPELSSLHVAGRTRIAAIEAGYVEAALRQDVAAGGAALRDRSGGQQRFIGLDEVPALDPAQPCSAATCSEAGHWVQPEQPERVSELMTIQFLRR
jgi:hypothetical protein